MKFGVREIVDVVFKATSEGQKVGKKVFKKYQPVFMIDTATTSSLEQASTTVYAQGGKGNSRLIAWEGEKTMTFTVTDALMSPMGLAVLTGAGLINPGKDGATCTQFHATVNKALDADGTAVITLADLQEETGLTTATKFSVASATVADIFATELDGSGAGIDWVSGVTVAPTGSGEADANGYITVDAENSATFTVTGKANTTVQLDFYLGMNNAITEVTIAPEDFGGYFYVEAATLYRREDTGLDMAAEIILPKVKVQSNFTFTMAASGDPSTFDFTMDAFPGYTRFNKTKKVMCTMQILGTDDKAADEDNGALVCPVANPTPAFPG